MAKIDNSTKGWGNVLKPQDQAETPIVIQSREMKLEEPVDLEQPHGRDISTESFNGFQILSGDSKLLELAKKQKVIDQQVRGFKDTEPLSREEAQALFNSGIWKKWSDVQLMRFQLDQPYLPGVDKDDFARRLDKVFGRNVGLWELENPAALKQELDKIIKQSDNLFLTGDFYSTPIHETRMAEAARHAPLSDSDYAKKELRAEADAKVEKAIHDRFEELMKEQEKQDRNQGLKM